MDAGAADVFQTVKYSRDKWTMDRVPWALLGILVGLAMITFMDPRPPGPRTLLYLGLMVALALVAGLISYVIERLFDRASPFIAWGLLIAVFIILLSTFGPPSKSPPRDMPPGAPGWIGVFIGIGWIAFALYRHAVPAKPQLMLSPAGISCHLPFLKKALIPWHEVLDVGPLDLTGPHGPPNRFPDITAVVISNAFYEQHILPKRRFAPGRGWENMFRPKGALMQMALPPCTWFKINPRDIREPVEARWKAFRDRRERATSVPMTKAEPPRGPAQAYGTWSPRLTPWQAVQFILPLIGILAVLAHAVGVWDTASLRAAREESAEKVRRLQEQRREAERIREILERSGVRTGGR